MVEWGCHSIGSQPTGVLEEPCMEGSPVKKLFQQLYERAAANLDIISVDSDEIHGSRLIQIRCHVSKGTSSMGNVRR